MRNSTTSYSLPQVVTWLAPAAIALFGVSAHAGQTGCAASARYAVLACQFAARDDLLTQRAICLDSPGFDTETCFATAAEDFEDTLAECDDVLAAQVDLCDELGNAPHQPAFGPDFATDFVDPLTIGTGVAANPWFPLVQGNRWVYEGQFEEDGEIITEVITITVTDRTKRVAGIDCLVVRDVVEIDGELIEDTDDWFAQDADGNVWYCGEEVKDYETFDGDEPAEPELISNDGSFKAGLNSDKGGVLLPAAPVIGEVIRQELSIGNAEDVIEIVALDSDEATGIVACNAQCLETRDFSPLDPGAEESKFYLPGVGKILEVNNETGDRVELIEFTSN